MVVDEGRAVPRSCTGGSPPWAVGAKAEPPGRCVRVPAGALRRPPSVPPLVRPHGELLSYGQCAVRHASRSARYPDTVDSGWVPRSYGGLFIPN